MEELELEIVKKRESICAAMVVEPTILEEIKQRQMETPKLKKIHKNLVAKPNSEFKMIECIFKFQNRICVPDIFDIKQ